MTVDGAADLETLIRGSLEKFRDGLKRHAEPIGVVREFITHGPCVAISSEVHALLREAVAKHVNIHPNRDVYTVGSAKLGFSINPNHRYSHFGDESDVDVAIVSPELYGSLWREARSFVSSGGLWESDTLADFQENHFRGYIKPDQMPVSLVTPTAASLWELARELHQRQAAGPYAVTFVVWHDMDALEAYQGAAVAACQESDRL
ncbi:hypothetical protein ACF07W_27045 [Streptomyces sp. NPDC015140]|uniref:hypothetical protein n=1 Tax=Streptomyces TaxID=1883 RepID=UPI0036C97905